VTGRHSQTWKRSGKASAIGTGRYYGTVNRIVSGNVKVTGSVIWNWSLRGTWIARWSDWTSTNGRRSMIGYLIENPNETWKAIEKLMETSIASGIWNVLQMEKPIAMSMASWIWNGSQMERRSEKRTRSGNVNWIGIRNWSASVIGI